jgi:hypothetical protein
MTGSPPQSKTTLPPPFCRRRMREEEEKNTEGIQKQNLQREREVMKNLWKGGRQTFAFLRKSLSCSFHGKNAFLSR